MTPHTWNEFRETGLLWWINRGLHLFGWAIVVECDVDTGEVEKVYPARVSYRGFESSSEERGFYILTKHLNDTAHHLMTEVAAPQTT